MIFITDESELIINENYNVYYFYADWLVYHKKMIKLIQKIEDLNYPINFFAINTDVFKTLCEKYKVSSIPTIIIFNSEMKKMKKIVGIILTQPFKKVFSDIFNSNENVKKI